jgi:Ca-activated chloride channel homolog
MAMQSLAIFDPRRSIALAVLAVAAAWIATPHTPRPRVLYVAVAPWTTPLPRALAVEGFAVRAVPPGALPALAGYDVVIVSDVPAHLLDVAALDRYAMAGGTLLIGGGAESFGTGAYEATALERMLPVHFDGGCRMTPDLAVAVVIDGSPASRATARSLVESLSPSDYVAVLGRETVSPRRAARRRELFAGIDRITGGGASLHEARLLLDGIRAASKHVVVVAAGAPVLDDSELRDGGIVLSQLDVGAGPASDARIAGALAPVDDELVHVRSLRGAPPLLGFVAMRTKASAEALLETTTGAPLLARWRRGAGVVIAWTSDLDGPWAADWRAWAGYAAFWSDVITGDSPRAPLP